MNTYAPIVLLLFLHFGANGTRGRRRALSARHDFEARRRRARRAGVRTLIRAIAS
jgi:hypothetical protein